jgi:hypothetical protein
MAQREKWSILNRLTLAMCQKFWATDKLFRTDPVAKPTPDTGNANTLAASNANFNQTQAEVLRLWTADFHDSKDLSAADKTYVTREVAAHTGMNQADAEKRVNDVIVEAKTDADNSAEALSPIEPSVRRRRAS